MGACGSNLRFPNEKEYRRAIKLYEVDEVGSLTNLFNRNKCFESGESPLTLAAREGHEAVVEQLLWGGADANRLDRNGRAPLNIATFINDEQTIDILLCNKGDPNLYDGYNKTAVHVACERGHANILKKLLKVGGDPNEGSRGITPIIYAATGKHSECIKVLLKNNANPNVYNSKGNTALHVAVSNSDVESVQALLEHGADPTGLTNREQTSLITVAALTSCPQTMQVLLDHKIPTSSGKEDEVHPIIAATARGSFQVLDILLTQTDICKNIDVADKRQHTALFIAAMSVVDVEKENFYCKYFSNVYRLMGRYDPLEIFPENSTKCAMSLVQAGASLNKVWERFVLVFPSPYGITFEQMVLCEVLIQSFGFKDIIRTNLRRFVLSLLTLREYGLIKLLFSSGVDPEAEDLYALTGRHEELDREMFRWVKQLRFNARPLKDLCRQQVRRCLSPNVLHRMDKLNLAESVKEYVGIMDTEHYSSIPDPNIPTIAIDQTHSVISVPE